MAQKRRQAAEYYQNLKTEEDNRRERERLAQVEFDANEIERSLQQEKERREALKYRNDKIRSWERSDKIIKDKKVTKRLQAEEDAENQVTQDLVDEYRREKQEELDWKTKKIFCVQHGTVRNHTLFSQRTDGEPGIRVRNTKSKTDRTFYTDQSGARILTKTTNENTQTLNETDINSDERKACDVGRTDVVVE